MDKHKASHEILRAAIPLVPFEGWNQSTLQKAALSANYKKTDIIRVFPRGAIDAVDAFAREGDALMLELLKGYNLPTMKIRERIATIVRLRITVHEQQREALRKAIALQAMPFHALHALRSLYATVDAIWHAAGDTSTDFNFYTKRLMLAGVYTSTVIFWLDDRSPGESASWEFLDRRIEDVMRIEKAKSHVKKWLARA